MVHRVPAAATTRPAGEALASHAGRVRGRTAATERVVTPTRATARAVTVPRRTGAGLTVPVDQARRAGDRRPTSRARRARTALRARRDRATVGVAGSAPPARDERVVQAPEAGPSRAATETTAGAAGHRDVIPRGVIRGPRLSPVVSGRADTTLIVRDPMAHHANHRTGRRVRDRLANASLPDGSRRPAPPLRSARSRSRLLAAFVSPVSRPRRRRGSARTGSTKDHCGPQRARPLSGRNARSPKRIQHLSRAGGANHRILRPTSLKFCRRVHPGPSPRNTGSV